MILLENVYVYLYIKIKEEIIFCKSFKIELKFYKKYIMKMKRKQQYVNLKKKLEKILMKFKIK